MKSINIILNELGFINESLINKDKFTIKCFLHNEKNGFSLFINSQKNFYKCFGKCAKSGTLTDLLLIYGFNISNYYNNTNENNKNNINNKEITYHSLDKIKFIQSKNCLNIKFLNDRNIPKEIYQANYIYQSFYNNRIYIPILFNSLCVGKISRTSYDENKILSHIEKELNYQYSKTDIINEILYIKENPLFEKYIKEHDKSYFLFKYLNSKDLCKEKVIYEPLTNNPSNNTYIVVESCLDSLYLNSLGYNSIAMIGAGITNEQIKYILDKYNDKILISAFDNDIAGVKYHDIFVKKMKNLILKIDWSLIKRNVKDVSDLSKNELSFLLNHITI